MEKKVPTKYKSANIFKLYPMSQNLQKSISQPNLHLK